MKFCNTRSDQQQPQRWWSEKWPPHYHDKLQSAVPYRPPTLQPQSSPAHKDVMAKVTGKKKAWSHYKRKSFELYCINVSTCHWTSSSCLFWFDVSTVSSSISARLILKSPLSSTAKRLYLILLWAIIVLFYRYKKFLLRWPLSGRWPTYHQASAQASFTQVLHLCVSVGMCDKPF